MFNRFDKDKKGYITAEDLFIIFRDMGEDEVTLEDCKTMIEANFTQREVEKPDASEIGLNFEEFIGVLMYR